MKKTILVVDDFEANTYAVGLTLKQAGYNVFQANSGKEALEYFDAKKIDLVVTDYKMPEMDGVELIINIRKIPGYKFVPVLMLTTETNELKKQKARAAGITGWIQKPFKINEFLKTVQKALQQSF